MGKFDNFILNNRVSRFIIDNYLFSQLTLIAIMVIMVVIATIVKN